MDKLTVRDFDPAGKRVFVRVDFNVPLADGKGVDDSSIRACGDALAAGTLDALPRLKPGQAILLENLRFHAAEEANDPAFAKALASYADVYVNDAFGTAHRAHASTVGLAKLLPAYAGLLMEREIAVLSQLLESPAKPFAAVIGGGT